MDSRIRLDYALFQLTPTRTRCDLVICAGNYKEKLASGLLEPYVSHLKFVKDEILKGGYSITLSAPVSASWFTKSTLERFVRFVGTPEVLERFVTIETEIKNIDRSINNNASSDSQSIYGLDEHFSKSGSFGYKHEDNASDNLHEEDPKFHLQRVLETRKAALQREQAMVYARALVAGFETDILQDLICFADAFGSPRLREACLSFIALCNTKSDDSVWMDEVAAMQAYSRSQYAYMEDDLGQELRINVPNSNFATKKPNGSVDGISNESYVPQYMHSYQGGPMFHPAYQGYPFPYYQGNHPWPPNVEDSRSRGRRSRRKRSQDLSQGGGNFDSSDSSSGSDSDSYKRSSKKKVIIKNINYVTSVKDEESEHESDATHEGQKVTQQWNIFQNLLMKDVDDKESVEDNVSHKFEDPNTIPSGNQPEYTKSSTTEKHEEKEWYMRSRPDKEIQERSRDIFEDHIEVVESTKNVLVEYPLTVPDRSLHEYDSQLKTRDSFMIPESDLTHTKVEAARVNEPNDLHMVLERDASAQQAAPAWTPEMESGSNNSKIVKMDSPEINKSKTKALVEKGPEKKGSAIEAKSKALVGSRRNKPSTTKTTIQKGRTEKEEEKRKRVEELLTQRQKRIAERSASTAKTAKNNKPKAQLPTKNDKLKAQLTAKNDRPRAKLPTKNDKPKALQSARTDKPKAQLPTKNDKSKTQQTPENDTQKAQLASRDMKSSNKRVIRSSTIDRLSAARVVNPKVISTKPKLDNKPMKPLTKKLGEPKPVHKPTKVTTNKNGVSRTSSSQKAAGASTKKAKPDKYKPLDKNIVSKNSYEPKKKTVDHNKPKQLPKASEIKKTGDEAAGVGSSTPAYSDNTKIVSETLHETALVSQKDTTVSNSNVGSRSKAVSFKISEDINEGKKKHETPVMESSSSKKKWSTLETSSKAFSGFKKLLSFGRRS